MTAHAEEMVLVPRAELDALRAENRRLRREPATERLWSASGQTPWKAAPSLATNWRRRGELVSDRVLRFPDRTWDDSRA